MRVKVSRPGPRRCGPPGRPSSSVTSRSAPLPAAPTPVDSSMITMCPTLDGFAVRQTLGVVRGIVVRSRSVFGTVGAKLQTLVGGNITLLTELCERTRADAFAEMVRHADALGANALLAVRYDATEVMSGVTEVLCYGTAVRVVSDRQPPAAAPLA